MTAVDRRSDEAPDPAALYDARYFDEQLHREHWFHNNAAKRELRWREIVRMLAPDRDCRVLELGCAAGAHAVRLAPLVREIVGVDFAPAAIERARQHAERAGAANATFLCGDARRLDGLADRSFDRVAAIDFVEHIDDATLLAVLAEARRVLRPGGTLSIFTPCATHYVERMKARNLILRQIPGHIAVRREAQYRSLLARAAFAIRLLYFSPSTYPLAGSLDRLLWRLPLVGPWFRFRLCIVAQPDPSP